MLNCWYDASAAIDDMFIVELINTTLVELIPIRYSELVPHYCLNIIAVDEMLFQGLFLTDRLEYFKRFKYKKKCVLKKYRNLAHNSQLTLLKSWQYQPSNKSQYIEV